MHNNRRDGKGVRHQRVKSKVICLWVDKGMKKTADYMYIFQSNIMVEIRIPQNEMATNHLKRFNGIHL